MENKWIRGAIPAVLLHLSIGSVYAFSLFIQTISEHINCSPSATQFSFSLAIFFLGMSAAFGGAIVEKNIHRSSWVSMVCFCSGLLITAVAMQLKSLALLYVGYGGFMGIGLGIGYLTPVKTLMLWFKDNKGFATGLSVCAFGFASSIASPIITFLLNTSSIECTFVLLAGIYMIPMFVAHLLLKKPSDYIETTHKNKFNYIKILKDKKFLFIWLVIFLNISCGLAVISVASPMLVELKYSPIKIALIISIMGIFNGTGRLAFSAMSDLLRHRVYIYYAILFISIVISVFASLFNNISFIALIVISACYGAGFSCLPSMLSDIYGMKNISKIHGLSLSAWAIAGLVGNQISGLIQRKTGSYFNIFIVTTIMYCIALFFIMRLKKSVIHDN